MADLICSPRHGMPLNSINEGSNALDDVVSNIFQALLPVRLELLRRRRLEDLSLIVVVEEHEPPPPGRWHGLHHRVDTRPRRQGNQTLLATSPKVFERKLFLELDGVL
jgi:hypothetical protein